MPGADRVKDFTIRIFNCFRQTILRKVRFPLTKDLSLISRPRSHPKSGKGFKDTLTGTDPSEIMGMYSPEMLPIMSRLAKGFAVCDRWFSSAPTQTLPNRAFAAAATSLGFLQNSYAKFFTCKGIFGHMSESNIDWAIYGYNREPMTRLDFPDTRAAPDKHYGRRSYSRRESRVSSASQ